MYMPGLAYLEPHPREGIQEWVKEKALAWLPLVSYAEEHAADSPAIEDEETLAKILEAQANDENAVDENGNLVGDPGRQKQLRSLSRRPLICPLRSLEILTIF